MPDAAVQANTAIPAATSRSGAGVPIHTMATDAPAQADHVKRPAIEPQAAVNRAIPPVHCHVV